jgi:hypothetical protein
MFDIPFDPKIHVISSLKQLLLLINGKDLEKNIQYGSIIVFDEPQVGANARDSGKVDGKMYRGPDWFTGGANDDIYGGIYR